MHTDPTSKGGNGWSDVGYHFIIRRDGGLEDGRPLTRNGAGVKGHNSNNIHICMVGGTNSDGKAVNNFTHEQFHALYALIIELAHKYKVKQEKICGHRDYPNVAKDCPCFDVREWLQEKLDLYSEAL